MGILQHVLGPADEFATKWVLVVVGILSSILLYALDTTITADVIPVSVSNLYIIYHSNKLTNIVRVLIECNTRARRSRKVNLVDSRVSRDP